MTDQIKVLVVDDSSLVRKIVTDILESDPQIKVVATANNGKSAIFKNREMNPDVITMDIEMPILDGLSALKYIIETNPKPVIMMSVLTQHGAEATFKALDYGAVDFIPKPSSILSLSVEEIGDLLISKVKQVARFKLNLNRKITSSDAMEPQSAATDRDVAAEVKEKSTGKLVGIGTSTGGPSALLNVFRGFPDGFPAPVLVVQHMPEGFTKAFSERLDSSSKLKVKEAEDGDVIQPGRGYIAPGHSHMLVEKKGEKSLIRLTRSEKISGHRPSIDVLFDSMAESYGRDTIAAILTGMGRDGATGISRIKKKGGYTIAQSEETSVVYGMNRVAVQEGAIVDIVPLFDITKKIIERL